MRNWKCTILFQVIKRCVECRTKCQTTLIVTLIEQYNEEEQKKLTKTRINEQGIWEK